MSAGEILVTVALGMVAVLLIAAALRERDRGARIAALLSLAAGASFGMDWAAPWLSVALSVGAVAALIASQRQSQR